MSDDVVCQIVRGELPAEVVLRNDTTIAFLDIRPVFLGHVLVCPTTHVDDLTDLSPDLVAPLFRDVRTIAAAVPAALGAQGTFVGINNRVSQSVPHLHVHVIPRTKGDGLRGFFWPRRGYEEGQAAEFAARLRATLGQPAA